MKTFTPWNGHHNRFLDPLDGPRGVQKTDSYTFFSWFLLSVTSLLFKRLMFVIPSLLYIDLMMTWMPYLTWILDLAIFIRQKYIFCIFYIFNVQDHLRGSFKDTFTLGLFLFWSSVSKIWSKKQTFTHFSADLLLPVTSLMFKRLMFVIPSLLYTDFMMNQMPYLTWILDLAIFRSQQIFFGIFYIFNVQYHLRGSFKDTFTLGLFLFWSSVSKIWSKKDF